MNQEKQGIAHHRGAVRPFGTVVADSAVQNNMLSSYHQMQTFCAKSEVDVPATGADPSEKKFLHLNLMFLASEKTCICAAQRGGVDRVLLDLETLGKKQRQAGHSAFLSQNTLEDVPRVRSYVDSAAFWVRVNPIHPGSQHEIDAVIAGGADVVMLPMAFDADQVQAFLSCVNGRAKTCVMIETIPALQALEQIVALPGIDECFIGINDLHIALGQRFMFELLGDGTLDRIARCMHKHQMPFGFGGIAKMGEGTLPSTALLGEHLRLGSSSVILSRAFRRGTTETAQACEKIPLEIEKIRAEQRRISAWNEAAFEQNHLFVQDTIRRILCAM